MADRPSAAGPIAGVQRWSRATSSIRRCRPAAATLGGPADSCSPTWRGRRPDTSRRPARAEGLARPCSSSPRRAPAGRRLPPQAGGKGAEAVLTPLAQASSAGSRILRPKADGSESSSETYLASPRPQERPCKRVFRPEAAPRLGSRRLAHQLLRYRATNSPSAGAYVSWRRISFGLARAPPWPGSGDVEHRRAPPLSGGRLPRRLRRTSLRRGHPAVAGSTRPRLAFGALPAIVGTRTGTCPASPRRGSAGPRRSACSVSRPHLLLWMAPGAFPAPWSPDPCRRVAHASRAAILAEHGPGGGSAGGDRQPETAAKVPPRARPTLDHGVCARPSAGS